MVVQGVACKCLKHCVNLSGGKSYSLWQDVCGFALALAPLALPLETRMQLSTMLLCYVRIGCCCFVVFCIVLQYARLYCTALSCPVPCYALLDGPVLYGIVLYRLYCMVLYCIVLCYIVLCCTVYASTFVSCPVLN